MLQLTLNHQNYWFADTNVTFAWKTIGQQCDPSTVYFINSTECVIAHESHNANKQYFSESVMEKQATIDTSYLTDENNKPMYFSISAKSAQSGNSPCDHIRIFNDVTVKQGGEFTKK